MEISPFFQKVWRFNAIIIALAGIAALIVLLLASGVILREIHRDLSRPQRDLIVTTAPSGQKPINESLSLGLMYTVKGHPTLYFPLRGEQSMRSGLGSYSSGDTRSTRNILFYDLKDDRSHWLLPSHDTLILDYSLYPTNYDNDGPPVKVILYELIYQDSDANNRLNDQDKITLALSTPQGRQLTSIIEDIDWISGKQLYDDSTLIVTYRRGEKSLLARVDLTNFTLLSTLELGAALPNEETPHQPLSP